MTGVGAVGGVVDMARVARGKEVVVMTHGTGGVVEKVVVLGEEAVMSRGTGAGAVVDAIVAIGMEALGSSAVEAVTMIVEEAVAKLSDRPARRFGCAERGQVRQDWFADLVVFDADTVVDNATYADPHQLPTGIDHVLVNGTPVITAGKAADLSASLPGRSLTFQP